MRSVTALACAVLALGLAGCGLFGDKADPKKDWTAAEYYKAAEEEFDSQNWGAAVKLYAAREALEGFKAPPTRFPERRSAPDPRERMASLIEALARHEINVARYYLRRGAYLAAANRAQDDITRFPNSPSHREALDIMIEAYDRMSMPELRDDAKKVLAKNFPGDPMAEASRNRTNPWWRFWR